MTDIITLSRPQQRPLYQWLLPLVFAVSCALGACWPGHGGHLFGIGGFAGVWACFLVTGDDPSTWLVPTVLGGAPLLWFFGRLLDRQQSDLRIWLGAAVLGAAVAGYLLLQGHSDVEAAIEHHGSFLAFCICAAQLGAYGATLVSLVLGVGRGAGA